MQADSKLFFFSSYYMIKIISKFAEFTSDLSTEATTIQKINYDCVDTYTIILTPNDLPFISNTSISPRLYIWEIGVQHAFTLKLLISKAVLEAAK